MSQFKYDKDKLLAHTDGGGDVIKRLFPELYNASGRTQNIILPWHDEKNPSTSFIPVGKGKDTAVLYSHQNGEVNDCFSLLKKLKGLSFGEACKWIAAEFNYGGEKVTFHNAQFKTELAPEGAVVGETVFEYKPRISEKNLKILGPLVTQESLNDCCNIKECISYTRTKVYEKDNPKHAKQYAKFGDKPVNVTISSTDNFPIFVLDEGDFQKIYQPLNADKKWRFSYAGKKQSDFIFGLKQLKDLHAIKVQDESKKFIKEYEEKNESSPTKKQIEDFQKTVRLSKVIIASGDRDAFNVSSLGYPVVWFNSESANINYQTISLLKKYANEVYLIPDIDKAGLDFAIDKMKNNRYLRVIFLPEKLKEYKDMRGNPRKDFRDFMEVYNIKDNPEHIKNKFKKLVDNAMPLVFWTTYKTKKGEYKHDINNEALDQFLWAYGYRVNKDESDLEDKRGYEYLRIDNNIITNVADFEIENVPINYLRDIDERVSLRNAIRRSPQINFKKFNSLPVFDTDIKYAGKDYQFLFFNNQIWKVTPEKIQQISYKSSPVPVFEENKLEHDAFVLSKKPFEIFKNDRGVWDIKINTSSNPFLNFLIDTSRIHWREVGFYPFQKQMIPHKRAISEIEMNPDISIDEKNEKIKPYQIEIEKIEAKQEEYRVKNKHKIDEKGLTQEQIDQQKLSLINKIHAYGFGMHDHKFADSNYVIYSLDNSILQLDKNNGRSGKSLIFNVSLKYIKNTKSIDGKKFQSANDNTQFTYDGVLKRHQAVCVDDANEYYPYGGLYTRVTSDFEVNPKGRSSYSIPFQYSPKMFISANGDYLDEDPSTRARAYYVPVSDYYHHDNDEIGDKRVTPKTDFGKMLFDDFDGSEFNQFYNFCAYALQFYMQNNDIKIEAPTENIERRRLLGKISENFDTWAKDFFTLDNTDDFITRKSAYDDYKNYADKSKMQAAKFKENVALWCKAMGFTFNPSDKCNAEPNDLGINTKIVKNVYLYKDGDKKRKAMEHFYIQTTKKWRESRKKIEESDQAKTAEKPADSVVYDYNNDDDDILKDM